MSKYSALIKRASNATAALALTVASLTPAVMLGSSAKAGQMSERQILMSNSQINTASSYTVSFKPTATTTIERIVVDFCEDSPIIGDDCSDPMDTMVFPTTGTVSVLLNGANGINFTVSGTDGTEDEVILSAADGSGRTVTAANSDVVSFVITGITNEIATPGSFYARIVTYETHNAAYADNNVGSYIDAGGVALATTSDITINARVKETLVFCVGATLDYNTITDCGTGWSNQTIDLGVLESATTATSPVDVIGTDGNDHEGAFLLTTNAFYGADIYYTSANSLRVGETTCENGDTFSTDQCINADAVTAAFPSAGTEKFGMLVNSFRDNEIPDGEGSWSWADTNGVTAGTPTYANGYGWDTDGQTLLGGTSSVVVNDVYQLTFKANVAATTPSGFYSTSANFVAVGQF